MKGLEGYKFSLDSWKLLTLEEQEEESVQIGSTTEETPNWRPIHCEFKNVELAFVDGVRRTENLIYIDTPEGTVQGAFVSVGAGAVLIHYGKLNTRQSSLLSCTVDRYLVLKKGVELKVSKLDMSWEGKSISFKVRYSDGELTNYVNKLMRDLELRVSKKLLARGVEYVVADGTLHFIAKKETLPIVGYVKKHKHLYVEHEKLSIFRDMKVGQRTPIIRIHSHPYLSDEEEDKFDKFTWYVRISEHEGLNGFARMEVSAELGIEKTVELANTLSPIIPRFASSELLEQRAPQNLLPVKYLENALRRQLGSQSLIRSVIAKNIL